MEAALRKVLKESLGEYIKGNGLGKSDLSSFPLVLRDLQLNEKKVQEEWDELHESAVQLTDGVIGSIKVTPGWMGTINVVATNIELNFSFSPIQAAKNSLKQSTQADDGYDQREAPAQGPPPMCPPRFCCAHDTSDKRVKGDPAYKDCKSCGINLQSSYKDFQLCPPCSDKEQRCMICGSNAPHSSSCQPPAAVQAPPPNCPPRFCCAHDSSDKRVKGDPCFKDCKRCGTRVQSSYKDFEFCPPCSDKEQKCMICGTHAPKSSTYMPGAPQDRPQAPTSGHAKHAAPPPPPAVQQPWENAPNRLPQGDAAAAKDSSGSMYLSHSMAHASTRPAVRQSHNDHYPQQEFQTKLPPTQSQKGSGKGFHQQSPGRHAQPLSNQNFGGNSNQEEGFSGFLRLVASDIWKSCSHDNHRTWDPPAQSAQFQGGPAFQGGHQGGVKRGGA